MLDLITLQNIESHKLIDGTKIHPLKINSDETGILVETMRTDWADVYDLDMPFAMQYYSITQPGIARDETLWHYHPGGQQDRFIVISGAIVVAIADNHDESPMKGTINLFYMNSDEKPFMIVVPKQALHAFIVVSKTPATLLNFPTKLYNPAEEGRIPFGDAQIKIADGNFFSWNMVREVFNQPVKEIPH